MLPAAASFLVRVRAYARGLRALLAASVLMAVAGGTGCGGAEEVSAAVTPGGTEARLVVDYEFGNRLSRSTLRIFENGVVVRTETTCCPAREEPFVSAPLSADAVADLLRDIEAISRRVPQEQELLDVIATTAGKGALVDAGRLDVVDESGRKLRLVAVSPSGDLLTETSAASQVANVVAVVNGIVSRQLPAQSP